MTPKEKAKELVERFWTDVEEFKQYETIKMTKEMAKDCALIAVDEIINDDWYIATFEHLILRKTYWLEVKKEIENL